MNRFYDEIDTNKDYYEFIGKSISFELLDYNRESENETEWQAFQGFIYTINSSVEMTLYIIPVFLYSILGLVKSGIIVPLISELSPESNWIFYFVAVLSYLKISLNVNMNSTLNHLYIQGYLE